MNNKLLNMITSSFPKITILLILASFLVVTLFGLLIVIHGPDGQMVGDCPFSLTNTTFCPQDLIASISHHLNAYHSFLDVVVNPNVTVFILLLTLIVGIVIVFQQLPLLFYFYRFKSGFYYFPLASGQHKIIHWLSLFENSPSLLRGA